MATERTKKEDDQRGEKPARYTSPEDLRRSHDATYRLLFQHREVFRELLEEHCGEWIDVKKLDLDRMERLAEDHVSDEGLARRGDLAWRVGYAGDGRHLVVVVEFQSTPGREMARRVSEYGALTVAGLERSSQLDRGVLQPYGLAVVVYTGADTWNSKGSFEAAGQRTDDQARLSRWSPYLRIDNRKLERSESGPETLLTMLGRAEVDGGPTGMRELRRRVLKQYPGPGFEKLRQHVQVWVGQLAMAWGVPPDVVESVWRLEDAEMIIPSMEAKVRAVVARYEAEAEAKGLAKGMAEGMAKGMAEGVAQGMARGRAEGRVEARAELRAEIVDVIRNGGTATEALARVERIVNGD